MQAINITVPTNQSIQQIAVFGGALSYHALAAQSAFPEAKVLAEFVDATQAVQAFTQITDSILLAYHNTLAGYIPAHVDLVLQNKWVAIGEVQYPIHLVLAALRPTRLESIRIVYSHAAALHQCKNFLNQYPNISAIQTASTTQAAEYAMQQPNTAALCSPQVAEALGLIVLSDSVMDSVADGQNITSFLLFSKYDVTPHDVTDVILFATLKQDELNSLLPDLDLQTVVSTPYQAGKILKAKLSKALNINTVKQDYTTQQTQLIAAY